MYSVYKTTSEVKEWCARYHSSGSSWIFFGGGSKPVKSRRNAKGVGGTTQYMYRQQFACRYLGT